MKISINDREIKNYNLNYFEFSSKVNAHTELKLELELVDKLEVKVNDKLKFEDINNIFYGIVVSYEASNYLKTGIKLNLVCKSFSYYLDKEKKSRIYQDINNTYYDIISSILSEYSIESSISNELKKKTGRIYLQYNETDFHFITRILNDIKEIVYTTYSGVFVIAYQELSNVKFKNIYLQGMTEKNTKYILKNEIYLTGDIYNNQYIVSSKAKLNEGIYVNEVLLSNKNEYAEYIYSDIRGAFIQATVVSIDSKDNIAKMKVDFSVSIEDKSKNKKLLSFATPYSKTHTGLYLTPEINDVVDVYFPSNNEDEAKVAFCINNENSSRFCNYNKREFINSNVYISIDEKRFDIRAENITFQANKSLNNISSSYIAIESKDETNIYADGVVIASKKNDIELNSSKNINLKADKIFNN